MATPRWSNLAFWTAASLSWLLVAAPPLDGYAVRLTLVTLTLGVAGRGMFVKLSPRSDDLAFLSPWILVLALGFAIALTPLRETLALSTATGTELATAHGLVEPGASATATDRCTGRQLEADVGAPTHRSAAFYRAVCEEALNRSIVLESGVVLDRGQLEAIKLQITAGG